MSDPESEAGWDADVGRLFNIIMRIEQDVFVLRWLVTANLVGTALILARVWWWG